MKYEVNGIIKEVAMKVWDGSQYSPDFFYDMEVERYNMDEDGVQHISAEQYAEMMNYWYDEVECANNGVWSEQFGDWREGHPNPEECIVIFETETCDDNIYI